MADPALVELLRYDPRRWNDWRLAHPDVRPDLVGAELRRAALTSCNLRHADLTGADLRLANLEASDLTGANLVGADLRATHLERSQLTEALLIGADLRGATLIAANLSHANLFGADIRGAILDEANFKDAILFRTIYSHRARSYLWSMSQKYKKRQIPEEQLNTSMHYFEMYSRTKPQYLLSSPISTFPSASLAFLTIVETSVDIFAAPFDIVSDLIYALERFLLTRAGLAVPGFLLTAISVWLFAGHLIDEGAILITPPILLGFIAGLFALHLSFRNPKKISKLR